MILLPFLRCGACFLTAFSSWTRRIDSSALFRPNLPSSTRPTFLDPPYVPPRFTAGGPCSRNGEKRGVGISKRGGGCQQYFLSQPGSIDSIVPGHQRTMPAWGKRLPRKLVAPLRAGCFPSSGRACYTASRAVGPFPAVQVGVALVLKRRVFSNQGMRYWRSSGQRFFSSAKEPLARWAGTKRLRFPQHQGVALG